MYARVGAATLDSWHDPSAAATPNRNVHKGVWFVVNGTSKSRSVGVRSDQILYWWNTSSLSAAVLHTRALPHLLAACLICCLAACKFKKTKKRRNWEGRGPGDWKMLVVEKQNVLDGGRSGGRVSDKEKVPSYLDPLSSVKAFRCGAPLSGSGRAELEQLFFFFLFLAADERAESGPDSGDYMGIWVTHYCHPNMCHPPRRSTWQRCTFLCERSWQNRWVSVSVLYD